MSSEQGLLAFVHIEKAAGTSTHRVLKRWFGTRYCVIERWRLRDDLFSARDLRWLQVIYPRLVAVGGHWIKPYGDLEEACPGGVRWWTLLRDPVRRCASHYQHQVQRMGLKESFEQWIQRPKYRNFQTRKLVGGEDAAAAIRLLEERFLFVGLAERFDESLLMLRKRIGLQERPLVAERENVSWGEAIKNTLLSDTELRRILEEANAVDREVYEHVRREIYPKEQAEYGADLEADLTALRSSITQPAVDLRSRWADLHRYLLYKPALLLARRLAR